VRIPRSVYKNIIEHCLNEYPRQACGMLAADGDLLLEHIPMKNAGAWPYGFQFVPYEQMQEMKKLSKENLKIGAFYHVHLTSRAYPTSKDVVRHYYKDVLCMIVSLVDEKKVELRSFNLSNARISEEPMEIIEDMIECY
jgi:proteasome lid subunit RPN8/RPN11